MMGPPGSGKGTQSQKMAQRHPEWKWLSTGDLLRSHMASKTALGIQASKYMLEGCLVPDQLLSDILWQELQPYQKTYVILDGFPRNMVQTKMLANSSFPVVTIFRFLISQEQLSQRIAHRAKIEHRKDDEPEKLKVRLEIYKKEMTDVYDYYQANHPNIFFNIPAENTEDQVANTINEILGQHLKIPH